MDFRDTALIMDGLRITADGYLVTSVKAARTGIQNYSGREVDPDNAHSMRDRQTVRVYRPESEVFNKDTLASFTSIPTTDDHPSEMVTADSWRKVATGNSGEEVLRDGETMRIPLVIKDAAAIKKIQDGKREISCGYTCDMDFASGRTADGLEYDAIQRNIRGNHIAVVGVARGGPELKIGDTTMPKTLIIDGHSVELSDAGAILVQGLMDKLATSESALKAANTDLGTVKATLSTRDGEVAALKTQFADAALTPAKLDIAVKARGVIVDAAKKIFPTVVIDGKTDMEIKRAAVGAKLTDAEVVKMNDDAVNGAFATLTAVAGGTTVADGLANAISTITPQTVADGAKKATDAREAMIAQFANPGAKAA